MRKLSQDPTNRNTITTTPWACHDPHSKTNPKPSHFKQNPTFKQKKNNFQQLTPRAEPYN